MDTQKRRVIYMADEEWDRAKKEAAEYGMTVSAYFRSLIVGGRVTPIAIRDEMAAIRDKIENGPNPYAPRGGGFNTQPFSGPIPKKR